MVYQGARFLAFMDIRQLGVHGHVLVVPTHHVETAAQLDEATAGGLLSLGVRISRAVRSATGCEGINFWISDGEAAGQEVRHVHLHLIPRSAGDGFGIRYPNGKPSMPTSEELDVAAMAIADKLGD